MKKNLYYQLPGKNSIMTEFEVKTLKLNKSDLKQYKLARHEVDEAECIGRYVASYGGGVSNLSSKALNRKETRKDMMRLGLIW